MNIQEQGFPLDLGASFTEDAPRPPVPGEEGELVSTDPRPISHSFCSGKGAGIKGETSTATPRRSDLDLGYEPEGSASPTPPYLKWAESLHSLLDDQDGINLFRTFLKQEDCADLLDFWFACSGFRKLEPCDSNEEKRLKLARAIYRKYILDNNGIVSRQTKPATKSFIKDCIMKQQIDPAMFDQAQTEIQSTMEENTYPSFLKSDIYLEYTRTGSESPKLCSDQSSGSGTGKGVPGYLPTLNEDEEWKCDQDVDEDDGRDPAPPGRLTQKLLLETAAPRASSSRRYSEGREFRYGSWREPVNPYYVNSGYALAPATSANDSEQQSLSSDADSLSLTDSSVDGVPPYRIRKQHRREMQESVQVNGRVPLPHIPRTYRMPKEVRVEPQKFAAELIHRLEAVQRTREAEEKLEERLKRVRMEEEGEDGDVSSGPPGASHKLPSAPAWHHFPPRYADVSCVGLRDAHEENPESILDEHVQRVMRTPGCQSPGPGHRSPDSAHMPKMGALGGTVPGHGKHVPKSGAKLDTAGLHLHRHGHHHGHHGSARPKEPAEAEASRRVQSSFAWGPELHGHAAKPRSHVESMGAAPTTSDSLAYSGKASMTSKRNSKKAESGKSTSVEAPGPSEDAEKNQKIMQWIIEGEKEISRHRKAGHGSSGAKKQQAHESSRPLSIERPGAVHPWVSAQLRTSVQPSHLFIQDPTMPPNPAPNPLTQLEEARRRLEEEEKRASKAPSRQRTKSQRKAGGGSAQSCDSIVVAYYFCGEPIPYRTLVRGRAVTLGQFKELLTKKGNYRYYFKKVSDEFECGVVFEEVREDGAVLPVFEEKVIGKVEKVD
ncbi:axin-1 isoform X2 [Monodon monoceros]|uniref:Axin-1 n=3 Tax=Odontoceti TaxID=9722 RepID=A0A6J3Q2A5_TURTR|nr:axin-1 isoform X2 [Delphinapterus leucas]XP_022450023.1 axin-1 isoform X2 [Delphinapterus leucas]XP_029075555.1 axin-1 isoform X2 [Monodon monoceros]XP_033696449.1 axin-1 isoform X4 [Tursiops truncatus]XP_033696450.1 axin-1 isoform X4 [Tursiops truncatus]XP_059887337.1 axin-1 isoform X2 [Delphinus delphis]